MTIEAGGSKAFSMRMRPRAIGRLDITITATSDEGHSDAVRKLLFVKVCKGVSVDGWVDVLCIEEKLCEGVTYYNEWCRRQIY